MGILYFHHWKSFLKLKRSQQPAWRMPGPSSSSCRYEIMDNATHARRLSRCTRLSLYSNQESEPEGPFRRIISMNRSLQTRIQAVMWNYWSWMYGRKGTSSKKTHVGISVVINMIMPVYWIYIFSLILLNLSIS